MPNERRGARAAAPPRRRSPFEESGVKDEGRDGRGSRRLVDETQRRRAGRLPSRRLFTATVAIAYDRHVMIAFHASMARGATEVQIRLAGRLGEAAAGIARICEGYDDASFIARTR